MSARKPGWGLPALSVAGAALAWSISCMRHERFDAVALLVAALSFYYLGARYYSAFLAQRVLQVDDGRVTPAHRLRDNRDYMPFRRWTLFGMHFAWIAGPGPLIGPTLAAQFGYLPGFLWIVLGAVLMGCVQDMTILFFSTRRDGTSLARMIKNEVSPFAGLVASFAVLLILEIILGVLALFVVNALKGSAWGTFTIACSIPIAFLVGWYMTRVRPGREGEATAVGVCLLIVATAIGAWIHHNPATAALFTRTDRQLAVAIVAYGLLAAALPAWMLLAPRDNISTYLKLGTVALLAVGIFLAHPVVRMPRLTPFIDGSGPLFGGSVFPFCFIVIACGAISGFHSLICSGTTPRFVDKESDIRVIGYGAMLTESFVGVMALIAAVTLAPGIYLAMTMPVAVKPLGDGSLAVQDQVRITSKVSSFGSVFTVTPGEMAAEAQRVGERSLYNRAGGAPTLAVGMAHVFAGRRFGHLLPFWYHFAIMFEAVFILTVLDSGTRVIRFVIQEMLRDLARLRGSTQGPHVSSLQTRANVWGVSALGVLGWGCILAWGILDTEGGVKALIRMFGTANQLLAVIALSLGTVILLKRKPRLAWVTGLPAVVVAGITFTAATEAILSPDPRVGALAAIKDASNRAALRTLSASSASAISQTAWITVGITSALIVLVAAVLASSAWEGFHLVQRAVPAAEAVD
ncbi:MAG: carbon starvation CstA family protein [Chthonomonadales bacterium]